MNGKQREIKALWEGGGADKLCQALFKNTGGFVFGFLGLLHQMRRTLCLPPSLLCLILVSLLPSFAPTSPFSPGHWHQEIPGHIFVLPVFSNNTYHQPASELPGSVECSSLSSAACCGCENSWFWKVAFCDVEKTTK